MTTDKFDIFVSHSTADLNWSRSLVDILREQGKSVFFDEDYAVAGGPIESMVRKALENSTSVVIVYDESSSSSPWAAFELGAALGMDKKVVPVVAPDVSPETLPGPVRELRQVSMSTPDKTAAEVVRLVADHAA